jgi:hypothetical protein
LEALFKALIAAPVQNILTLAGIVFLLIAVGVKLQGKIDPTPSGRRTAGIVGAILLLIGLATGIGPKVERFQEAQAGTEEPPTDPKESPSPTRTPSPSGAVVAVPDVYDVPEAEGRARIADAGLTSRSIPVCSSSVAAGGIRQVKDRREEVVLVDKDGVTQAGQRVPAGSLVVLKVSTGVPCG